MSSRCLLRLCLCFFLTEQAIHSLLAAPGAPAGFVIASDTATIAGRPVTRGQTLLSGDRLEVGSGTTELAFGGGNRVALLHGAEVQVENRERHVLLDLHRGTASLFFAGPGQPLRVRVGSLSIQPAREAETRGDVQVTEASLIISARQGALNIDGGGEPFMVGEGTAVKFTPDRDPAPTSTASLARPRWVRATKCALGGAILGGVPLYVQETKASPDTAWGWLILGGGLGGELICMAVEGDNPPDKCKLSWTADPKKVDNQSRVDPGTEVTLEYHVPKGKTLKLVAGRCSDGKTVKDGLTGDGTVKVTINANTTYRLCPTDDFSCTAPIKVRPACSISASTPEKVEGKTPPALQLDWTTAAGVTGATLTGGGLSETLTGNSGDFGVNPTGDTTYTLKAGGETCTLKVLFPSCTLKGSWNKDKSKFKVTWSSNNATELHMEPPTGQLPASQTSFEYPAAQIQGLVPPPTISMQATGGSWTSGSGATPIKPPLSGNCTLAVPK